MLQRAFVFLMALGFVTLSLTDVENSGISIGCLYIFGYEADGFEGAGRFCATCHSQGDSFIGLKS